MSCQKLCFKNCRWLLPTHVLQVVNDLIKLNTNYTTAHIFARAGSLSNDYGDGNENGDKAIGLNWQNNNFARASRFFVHFPAVVARLQRETALSNFMFRRGREHKTTTFFFFSWTLMQSFRIQFQKTFVNIWRIKRDGMSVINSEALQIHLLSDVSLALAVVVASTS